MPRLKRRFQQLSIAAGWTCLGACATFDFAAPQDVVVRHHVPSDIIVAGSSVGRFRTANGCIYFDREAKPVWRIPVLFVPGTRLSDDRRSIVLPGRQSIPFGRRVRITAEVPPNGRVDETCGPRPYQVLEIEVG